MPMKTINAPLYLLGLSVILSGPLARAQVAAPAASDQAAPSAAPPASPPSPPPESASDRSAELTPPVLLPSRVEAAANPVNPWFVRPSYDITNGQGKSQWKLTAYGFAEFDFMYDTTRSFADGMNSNVAAHSGTQAGDNARFQTTIRNTRIGFKMNAPELAGIKPSGVIEGDFFGYDPSPPTTSEAGFFNNPTFRIRHAYVKLESDVVNVLGGQMYHLLGWQNYFFPTSLAFLGLPNQLFNRTQQLRISHSFKSDDVNVDVAVAGLRPVQRDSAVPDGEAGILMAVNHWKGISTPGNGGTAAFPAALGVSGLIRRFSVDQFAVKPSGVSTDTGWAVAANALIPIIPAVDNTDRTNALTLIGEATVGSGYAEQFTGMSAGASFPALPGGAAFAPDIDNGLVTYDTSGILHTINWRSFVVDLQYYLPPSGRMLLALNYTQSESTNMADLFAKSATAFKESQYFDGNVFFDVTPSVRVGAGYQFLMQTFVDNSTAHNHRLEGLMLYFF
jgi:hypothetical protein